VAADPERSRWWELEHSWWLGLIALGCGLLTWAGFGYIALRIKRIQWYAWAAAYLALIAVSIYLLDAYDEDQWQVAVGVFGVLGCWIGGFVHGLAIRGEVVDLLSLDEDPRLKDARRRLRYRGEAGKIASANPALAREAGIGTDAQAFGGLVDVNSADAEEFAQLPGISVELAKRIMVVRENVDGFDSVLDFANLLDLPPRFVDGIRDRLICLPR
jgi:SARP family transcriptional regulator, regulator of embCAB operon